MYILGFLLVLVATYALYLRSDKTTHQHFSWEKKGRFGRKSLSIVALSLFVASAIVFYMKAGLLGGFCYGIVVFFCIASLVVLLRPLMTAEKSKVHARK